MVGFNYQPQKEKERIACEIATMAKDGPVLLPETATLSPDTRFHYIDFSLEEQVKAITGAIEERSCSSDMMEIITAE